MYIGILKGEVIKTFLPCLPCALDQTTREQENLMNVVSWVKRKLFIPLQHINISREGRKRRTAVETLYSPTVLKYPLRD